MLKQFNFLPFNAESKPADHGEVLLFLHDKWRGYDEIVTATFDGTDFYVKSVVGGALVKVRPNFVAGWLELPVKLVYGSSSELLPRNENISARVPDLYEYEDTGCYNE